MLTQALQTLAPHETAHRGAASSTAAADVLEPMALERLRALDPNGENQLLTRVAQAFSSSVQRLMPQLNLALAQGPDTTTIHHIAHTLKSSSASLGAMRLSGLCAKIELDLRSGQLNAIADDAAALQTEVHVVQQALNHMLARAARP
jgi:HPt (histidine-containing phosphotransfer) domain-containing protein